MSELIVKIQLIALVILFVLTTSCSRKVCGGPGGKRCVEISAISSSQRIS